MMPRAQVQKVLGECNLGLCQSRQLAARRSAGALTPLRSRPVVETSPRQSQPLGRVYRLKLTGQSENLALEELLGLQLLRARGDTATEVSDLGFLNSADQVPEVLVLHRHTSQDLIGRITLIDARFVQEQEIAHRIQCPSIGRFSHEETPRGAFGLRWVR